MCNKLQLDFILAKIAEESKIFSAKSFVLLFSMALTSAEIMMQSQT